MDGATMNRKYPSYTTADLEAFVASGQGNAVMVQEIAERNGYNVPGKSEVHIRKVTVERII